MRCDFCFSEGPITVALQAADFELLPGHWSRGAWATCAGCAPYVCGLDWPGLVARVVVVDPDLADAAPLLLLTYQRLESHAGLFHFVGGA